jgi:hypothetical protein
MSFTLVSVAGAMIAASSAIKADLTPFIALAAVCSAGLGFAIGYWRTKRRG